MSLRPKDATAMANLASLLIFAIFLWGRTLHHKNLRLHIQIMLASLIADLTLVIVLVVFRDALGTVAQGDMPLILMIHVPIAISTVLLYFIAAWNGYQLYRGNEKARARLRIADRFLVAFRALTLITSFLVPYLR